MKRHNIKPCYVDLTDSTVSKMKISCSAYLKDDNVQLTCNILQSSLNNFVIRIKRKHSRNKLTGVASDSNPAKKLKTANHDIPISSFDFVDKSVTKPMEYATKSKVGLRGRAKKRCNALAHLDKFSVSHVKDVAVGDVVLCKMRGYPEWPAQVIERLIPAKNCLPIKVTVKFFGDQTTHTTTIMNVFDFFACRDLMISKLQGRKLPLYSKSIKEAQGVLNVKLIDEIHL